MPPKVSSKADVKTKIVAKAKKNKTFEVGEKILCYQKGHLYEAKCLETRKVKHQVEFRVHYHRWKGSKYDEWVSADRVLKHNVKNLKKQKELREAVKKEAKIKSKKISANDSEKQDKKTKISTKTNNSESGSFKNPGL